MKTEKKERKNYGGQEVTDSPGEDLINPPDPNRPRKPVKKGDRNTTAKDPNRGGRNPVLR